VKPEVLRANPNSELTISVYPVNLMGFKTPFGETNARFDVEQGANLIELREISPGIAKVRSKGIEGEATVGIYSLKSGILIQKILVKILPKDVAELNL
jgi:hypothetical protein